MKIKTNVKAGETAGKVTSNPIVITKKIDVASTKLFL